MVISGCYSACFVFLYGLCFVPGVVAGGAVVVVFGLK